MPLPSHRDTSPCDQESARAKTRDWETMAAEADQRLQVEGAAAAAKGAAALQGWMDELDGYHTARISVRMGQRWREIVQSLG
jgi:hypothetical protein